MGVREDLKSLGNKEKAGHCLRFFKTGKGEYGEGDKFLGVSVPEQRTVAKKYKHIGLDEIEPLLKGSYHEYRLTGLFMLVQKYKKSPKEVVELYLKNKEYVNNWDLVDSSAHKILGVWLLDKDRNILYDLVKGSLWDKRIAIISCFTFIREKDYDDALKISEILLHEKHDLLHKAVGWMLREVGNRDLAVEEKFLKKHYKVMPRMMLRYAIEKFEESKRKKYLRGEI
jgi:3-methyladenine DNA glycosylase AlkD